MIAHKWIVSGSVFGRFSERRDDQLGGQSGQSDRAAQSLSGSGPVLQLFAQSVARGLQVSAAASADQPELGLAGPLPVSHLRLTDRTDINA